MQSLDPVPKFLILLGLLLLVSGILWHFGVFSKLHLGRLPGDIVIERSNTKIYIPVVTCLILSLAFSLISSLYRFLIRK